MPNPKPLPSSQVPRPRVGATPVKPAPGYEAEDQLKRQLHTMQIIADNASACMFMIDGDGLVRYINPSAKRVTGFSEEDALGRPMHKLVHHSYTDGRLYPENECPMVLTYTYGMPNLLHEDVFYRKDGTPFPVLVTGTPFTEAGGVRGTVVEFRDITDERRANQDLLESEDRFRTLADNIQNLAWMANADGWIFWYNKQWYDYTGFNLEEMQGWGWDKAHHPDHIDRVVTFVKEAWGRKQPYELTFPLKAQDGTFRWFLTRVFPITDEQGRTIRWIGTNTDIDEQHRALDQKNEFIGIASHELKTPVTSLKAYAQVMQRRFEKRGDLDSAHTMARINAQLDKLTGLIVDLLDVTKIESGKLQFNMSHFDLDGLVRETVASMQLVAERHELIVTGELGEQAYGDPERLAQVLINFISNAIKYTPNVSVIHITVERRAGEVVVNVQDQGLGISEDMQKQVFDRFFRVTGPRMESFPGLGLGLYISSEIIKRLDGRIWVKSAPGEGSTFSFSLPLPDDKTGDQV